MHFLAFIFFHFSSYISSLDFVWKISDDEPRGRYALRYESSCQRDFVMCIFVKRSLTVCVILNWLKIESYYELYSARRYTLDFVRAGNFCPSEHVSAVEDRTCTVRFDSKRKLLRVGSAREHSGLMWATPAHGHPEARHRHVEEEV
jgi:hypothetical protein